MKFGAHAFIWEAEWNKKTGSRVISEASRLGLDFVELPLLRPSSFDSGEVKKQLANHGIYATYSLGLPAEANLPAHPKKAEEFLKQAIDVVADAGGEILTGVVYSTLGEFEGRRPVMRDYQVLAETLHNVATYAGPANIRLGIEPVNRYETFLINTAQQAVDLLDLIRADNVFIHLDTYHLNIEELSFRSAIQTAGDRMGYIHLSESHRGTPGQGTVDWDDVFSGLKDIEFRGELTMESFVKLHPDIARATCMWRDIVKDSEALITDGLAFLRGKAKEYGLP